MNGTVFLRISKNLLELASLIAMAAVFVLFAGVFSNYPDPTNEVLILGRNFAAEKIGLFILLAVCGGVNACLFIVSRFPSLYKYPFKITAENIEVQYHIAKIMLSIVQIIVSVYFWDLFFRIYAGALQSEVQIPVAPLLVAACLIAAAVGVYLLLAHKFK